VANLDDQARDLAGGARAAVLRRRDLASVLRRAGDRNSRRHLLVDLYFLGAGAGFRTADRRFAGTQAHQTRRSRRHALTAPDADAIRPAGLAVILDAGGAR